MKHTLRITSAFTLLAGTQIFLTGCATPGSPSLADTTEIQEQALQEQALRDHVLSAGVPVALDLDNHLYYGNLEVSTTESGAKRIVLNTEADDEVHATGFFWRLPEPMEAGDQFVLTLTARTIEGGSMSFPVMVEMGEAPWIKSAIDTLSFDGQSRSQRLVGVMNPEAVGAPTHVNLHLGQLNGVLEIEALELVRLPHTAP
ncbi:MAG: hypothetical protein JJU29_08595 [Verrucomicrobia bacterium]|nr:hypothetical protein [Verrucomicrobiota bacterium]MCH8512947.1 hypothetical protein [Kiritimatiellia bacterium]